MHACGRETKPRGPKESGFNLPFEVIEPEDQHAAEMSGRADQSRTKKKKDAECFAPALRAGVALGQDDGSHAPSGGQCPQPPMNEKDLPRPGRTEGCVKPAIAVDPGERRLRR